MTTLEGTQVVQKNAMEGEHNLASPVEVGIAKEQMVRY